MCRSILFISALRLLPFLPVAAALAGNAPPAGQYEMDPGFRGGKWVMNHFLNSDPGAVHVGRKLARLENGDLVVAGLVSPWQSPYQGGGLNIGLIRYSPAGQLQSWGASSPHHFYNGEYVIYPNSGSTYRYSGLHDIQVFDGRIHVLVDTDTTLGGPITGQDVHVVVFYADGTYLGEYPALSRTEAERGAGMAFVSPLNGDAHLYVAGTTDFSDISRPTLVRFTVNSDGTLTKDGGFGWAGYQDYQPPDSSCHATAQPCESESTGIAVTRNLTGGVKRLYLGGSMRYRDGDRDFLAIAVDADGQLVAGFGAGGYRTIAFDTGGSLDDSAVAIAARSASLIADEVFLIGYAHRNEVSYQTAVVRLNQAGSPLWQTLAGGCQAGGQPPSCPIGFRSELPYDAALVYNGAQWMLGIAGLELFDGPSGISIDPVFFLIDSDTGFLAQFTRFPWLDGAGERLGDAAASGIVPAGPHGFALAGPAGAPEKFITARIAVNTLFADRFEPAPID